ncbi:unnamed protein product, partial [Mesorhabditis spiculigera]
MVQISESFSKCTNLLCQFFVNKILPYLLIALLILKVERHYFAPRMEYPFLKVDNTSRVDLSFRFRQSQRHENCGPNTTLFIGVISRPTEFDLRESVRNSWAKKENFDANFTRVEFFVGKPKDWEIERLHAEMWQHGDISIIDMEEDYYALPQKTLGLLMYKEQQCPRARCLIKSDSDNVLNVPAYERLCNGTAPEAKRIYGACSVKTKVQRHGKWSIPRWLLPQKTFPQYCSTGIYMFAGNSTVNDILERVGISKYSRSANYRKLPEDVLFSGIFPEQLGISRITIPGVSFNSTVLTGCENGTTLVYSLHMTSSKDPAEHLTWIRNTAAAKCFDLNLAKKEAEF